MRPALSRILFATTIALLSATAPGEAQIKLGAFGPMTGDAAAYGQSLREGVEIAVKEQNAKGGVLGQQIAVIYGDDAGKPEQAVNVVKRLVNSDQVLVLLGSISSPSSLAASQVAAQTETPQVVITSTAQRITTQGNPWVFRSTIPDTVFAESLATFIAEEIPGQEEVCSDLCKRRFRQRRNRKIQQQSAGARHDNGG